LISPLGDLILQGDVLHSLIRAYIHTHRMDMERTVRFVECPDIQGKVLSAQAPEIRWTGHYSATMGFPLDSDDDAQGQLTQRHQVILYPVDYIPVGWQVYDPDDRVCRVLSTDCEEVL